MKLTPLQKESAQFTPLKNSTDSLSCLHTLEHFGLGRHGDPIDPEGHIKRPQKSILHAKEEQDDEGIFHEDADTSRLDKIDALNLKFGCGMF